MKKLIAALSIIATLAAAAPAMAQSVVPTSGYTTAYSTTGYTTAGYATGYPQPFCPALSYNMYIGLSDRYTGGQVTQLQQYLSTRGYNQPVTGYFGSITRANVAALQRALSVYPVTGGVGPLTRAAIAQTCGQGGGTTSNTFSTGVPFTATQGQTLAQYGGQLDFTLNTITSSLYTTAIYPGYTPATSATVTLGQRCQAGTYCFYYPQQQFTLTVGQTVTWMTYTVTLLSLNQTSGTFVVTQSGGTTQGAPTISSVTPNQGPVGTTVTITGSGFSSNNTVYFGNGGTQNVPSYNGTTIVYTIPSSIGAVCASGMMCPQYLQLVTPGTYNLSVSNGYGQSSSVPFTVTQQTIGGVTVSSPTAGAAYNRGQDMTITWGYPVTPNSTQMMLELYSVSGTRIGLIAVSQSTSGSYTWHIPGFPQNYMCTLQYPNGLCGTNIPDGQYYVKVSASNNPLDSNPSIIASGQSGTFTITGAGTSNTVVANPQSGQAPLTVTFSLPNYSGSYFVNYGDGTSASLVSGQTSHTYYNRGTYTATFTSDYACLHSTPACYIAQQNLGSATVTVN